MPQLLPVLLAQVVDSFCPVRGQLGQLDPVGQDGPKGNQVGVDSRVRLRIGVFGTEELARVLGSDRLDCVDVLAAGVKAISEAMSLSELRWSVSSDRIAPAIRGSTASTMESMARYTCEAVSA